MTAKPFIPFPEISTERMLLRKVISKDAAEIFFLRSDKDVLTYIGREPAANIQEAEKWITQTNEDIDAGNVILWGIAFKDDPAKIIGTIGFWRWQKEHFRAEIGYVLHPAYWRKGIMKEAITKVIRFGFNNLQLHSIEARIDAQNTASAALLETAGFVKEGYFKEDFFFHGQFGDTIVYSRLQ